MRVWKFGNDVDTDAIVPGKYLTIYDPQELAKHAFENVRPEFARDVVPGDVIVGGRNFGSGSSREHAPLALKGAGVRYVVAQSFARIFFRNAINIGLLPLVSPATDEIADGSIAEIDIEAGTITVDGVPHPIEPIPEFVREIADAGGLVPYARGIREVETCTVSRR